jgi:hypothetical protein
VQADPNTHIKLKKKTVDHDRLIETAGWRVCLYKEYSIFLCFVFMQEPIGQIFRKKKFR